MDSKVLRATFTGSNSQEGEGLFLATVVNFGNSSQMGVDMSYYMIYDITAITSKKDEFINYQKLFNSEIDAIKTPTYTSISLRYSVFILRGI